MADGWTKNDESVMHYDNGTNFASPSSVLPGTRGHAWATIHRARCRGRDHNVRVRSEG